MDFRKFDRSYVVRFDKGEELVSNLKVLCEKEGIHLASVQGIASADHVVLGVYDNAEKTLKTKSFDGTFEVASILGNITTFGPHVYDHLHAVISNEAMETFGGHVVECTISGSAELILTTIPGEVGRVDRDDSTGLKVIDFAHHYIEI